MSIKFIQARPVWLSGREKEMNVTMGFRTLFMPEGDGQTIIRLTTSGLYRCFVNGNFIGSGPARGPHGYFRVDEWDLSRALTTGVNIIAVETVGYNVNSYYLLNQPSFLQAEIESGGQIVAYTASNADKGRFPGRSLQGRIQNVQRYSFQRTFVEYYRLQQDSMNWLTRSDWAFEAETCDEASTKLLLPRRVTYPDFRKLEPVSIVAKGCFRTDQHLDVYWRDRSLTRIGPTFAGYELDNLSLVVSDELLETATVLREVRHQPYTEADQVIINDREFIIFDFGINLTGMMGLRLRVAERAKLYVIFDEILSEGDVDFLRLYCVNAIGYELEPGEYDLESIEPYTMRYAKLMVMQGKVELNNLSIREFVNSQTEAASFRCDRQALNDIFDAGVETFKQNATDLYMDCPSRERAGWLCDSYFISRVEHDLTGTSLIETNFLENYLLPAKFSNLPDGMLPMCYPADHDDGVFISNWALWFVLELEEYVERTGDVTMRACFKDKINRLFDYFLPFENEHELLENLDNWVFLEWSKANDFIEGVNYPSNMLYAGALSAAGRLYGDESLLSKAERIRETIRKYSFDGMFFVDQALRTGGRLASTGERTEVCQYYAFAFNVATPDSYPELWERLYKLFGPSRKAEGDFRDIYPANAFIGNYLRLDLLSRYGRGQQTLTEMEDYFHYMAAKTGTLWENISTTASCNHGFASHVVHWLYQEGLGLRQIDHIGKRIEIHIDPSVLQWCEGSVPVHNGIFRFGWRQAGEGIIKYSIGKDHNYGVILGSVEGYILMEE